MNGQKLKIVDKFAYLGSTLSREVQKLKIVDKFTYLGSTLSRAVQIDDEVTSRIAKTSVAFGRLRGNVWKRNGIKVDTKSARYFLHFCMHVKPGKYTSVMQRDLIISTSGV